MTSVNKVVLVGRLGADPEMRVMPSGDTVAKLSVATNDRRSDGKGGFVEATEWHRVSIVGRQADVARDYLRKGSLVYVEGKLRTATWIGKDGVERKTWSILSERMVMLGSGNGTSAAPTDKEASSKWIDTAPPEDRTNFPAVIDGDDIPF